MQMQYIDYAFLVSVFFGLLFFYHIINRALTYHAHVIANKSLEAVEWFYYVRFYGWLVCSTYNCWYLFVH